MNHTVADVSSNNGTINWAKAAPTLFGVYVKATEGATWIDPTHEPRAIAARKAGLHTGYYHYARPANNPPDKEANHFLDTTGRPHKGDLIPVLDFETAGHEHAAGPVEWARQFNRTYHDATGIWPLFYSYTAFIHDLAPDRPIGGGLWLAAYGADDGRRHPVVVPSPWRRVRLHQYTSNGSLPGVAGRVDLSHADKPLGLVIA